MSDDRKPGWRAGETFFEESGGRPADPAGAGESGQGTGGGDPHLPASEAGAGIIPEDESGPSGDDHLPASEADTGMLAGEEKGTTQSWPGSGGPGTIPPPG
jgi:hypothetical protein